jgi:hypothetical protein
VLLLEDVLLGGTYATWFIEYAKAQFLSYAAVLQRGFFKMEKGVLGRKKVARRTLKIKAMSEEQMDELLELTKPLHDSRDKDQHKELIDPSALYELLKSLEPTIGREAFLRLRGESSPA